MASSEQAPESMGNENAIWQLLMRQLADVPQRYRVASANQYFAAKLKTLPLGFDEESAGFLASGSILSRDIESINLCLAALKGKVAFKVTPASAARPHPAEVDTVASVDRYDPAADRWRIDLASGYVANFSTADASEIMEYRP